MLKVLICPFMVLVCKTLLVASQISISSHPEDSADDNIGTDLDGMKTLFADVLKE